MTRRVREISLALLFLFALWLTGRILWFYWQGYALHANSIGFLVASLFTVFGIAAHWVASYFRD